VIVYKEHVDYKYALDGWRHDGERVHRLELGFGHGEIALDTPPAP
jgi:hypothetical protein